MKVSLVFRCLALLALVVLPLRATENVAIDRTQVLKTFGGPPIGLNLSFLMDSDARRPRTTSNKDRIAELGVGFLRFPMGGLSDNYLWTTAPYTNAVNGLTPRVATLSRAPGGYYWAVKDDGTFADSANNAVGLDFDEFMLYCNKTGATPIVVVNMKSEFYPDGPTRQTLVDCAAAWVNYANNVRGYGVKYWQIGNEPSQDSATTGMTSSTYITLFKTYAAAMKAVDPTIKTGFAEQGHASWLQTALADPDAAALIDFATPHQYVYPESVVTSGVFTDGYEAWRDNTGQISDNVIAFQGVLSVNSTLPLIVTESNGWGGSWVENQNGGAKLFQSAGNNLYVQVSGGVLRADATSPNGTMTIELLKDEGWVRLKAPGYSTYVKAGTTAAAQLALDGTGAEDEARWRLQHRIDVAGGPDYMVFESKKFPGKYIRVKSDTDPVLDCNGGGSTYSRFTTTYLQSNVTLPGSGIEKQLRNKSAAQIAGVVSGAVQGAWRSTSSAFLFTFEDLGSNVVRIRNSSTGQYLTTSASGATVAANGSGSGDDSKWLFTPAIGYTQFESKLYPGQFLRLSQYDAALDALGSSSEATTQFTMIDVPVTNPTAPNPAPDAKEADLWKALLYGDMLFEMFEQKNVTSALTWVTHQPDDKFGGGGRVGYLLTNDDANALTVVGALIKTINAHANSQLLGVTRVHGKVLAMVTFEPTSGELTAFLINKNNTAETTTLTLSHFTPLSTYERYVFRSATSNPEDAAPTCTATGTASISGNVVTTTLDPISMTVIHLHDPATRVPPTGSYVTLKNQESAQLVRIDATNQNRLVADGDDTQPLDLTRVFKVVDAQDGGRVRLFGYGGTGNPVRYFSGATTALDANSATLADDSKWTMHFSDAIYGSYETKTYAGRYARANAVATPAYLLDSNGGGYTWSLFDTAPAPNPMIGRKVWMRSIETNNYVYVDAVSQNLHADTALPSTAAAHLFTVESAGGAYVRLKSELTGNYVKCPTGATSLLVASGSNTETATKLLLQFSAGTVLFDSAVSPGDHVRVKVTTAGQPLDYSGSVYTWSQFYWGEP